MSGAGDNQWEWHNESVGGGQGGSGSAAPAQQYQQQQYQQQQGGQQQWAGQQQQGTPPQGQAEIFTPNYSSTGGPPAPAAGFSGDDFANEPPLLEEIGVNFENIKSKTMGVIKVLTKGSEGIKADAAVIEEADLVGPMIFCLALGAGLVLHGKVNFGNIYALALFSCAAIWLLLNLMTDGIEIVKVASVLGYGLLPMVGLAFLTIVVPTMNWIGFVLGVLTIAWCTMTAAIYFEVALKMDHQKWLVAYPIGLCYTSFALITLF